MGSVTDLDQVFETFKDPHQEWRRLVAEFVGTFFLVLVAAGAPMMGVAVEGSVHRLAAVVAPGWMVMGVILAFGKISGAHLNPFPLRFAVIFRGAESLAISSRNSWEPVSPDGSSNIFWTRLQRAAQHTLQTVMTPGTRSSWNSS